MLSVGLTGGIGSGKSAVSALLAGLGAAVVDADLVAREVVARGTVGLARVVAAFGADVLAADGSLDRPALGAQVFADDQARQRLNAIVHPLIGERTVTLMGEAERHGARILVHDVPLLVESGLAPGYHLVAVVGAPVDVRLARLADRGLPPEQARSRMAAQADDAQRRSVADAWLENGGTREHLAEQVQALWHARLVPYASNVAHGRPARRGPVRLVPPQEQWQADGARLVARLQQLTGAPAHHIGSTAVPGLMAKDVVDLQIEVADWAAVEALEAPLGAGGFVRRQDVTSDPARAELDPDPTAWRKHVHLSADPGRAANVHVRVAGTTGARAALAWRDLLRADPAARESYAAGKQRSAELHGDDVDAYAESKTNLIVPRLVPLLVR